MVFHLYRHVLSKYQEMQVTDNPAQGYVLSKRSSNRYSLKKNIEVKNFHNKKKGKKEERTKKKERKE